MKLEEFLNGKNVETYFDEKLKECKDYDELPRELNNCTCCSRHRINFPILGRDSYLKSIKLIILKKIVNVHVDTWRDTSVENGTLFMK